MKLVVITSCTGEKAADHPRKLTLDDFRRGEDGVRAREAELADLMLPAEAMYTRQQHVRVMRGIRAARQQGAIDVDLRILSAGYGLLRSDRPVAPYECTFQGMKMKERRAWAEQLNVPEDVRRVLAQRYDLALILLGEAYLEACRMDETVESGGPTLVFCGTGAARRLPALDGLRVVTVTNREARRFSCGSIALKGELGARVLERLVDDPGLLPSFQEARTELLELLEIEVGREA